MRSVPRTGVGCQDSEPLAVMTLTKGPARVAVPG